jgi:gamma-glutamyltranspeptidase/glutathione hydrolase/leukotriene-C4 hydrolase
MSPKTGVIFNNQMADFSSPGITTTYGIPSSKANRIKPGKRPVSSKSSAIVIDNNGDVRLTIGGSGGTHMISGIAAVCHYIFEIINS